MGGDKYKTVPVYSQNPDAGGYQYSPTRIAGANAAWTDKPVGYQPTYVGMGTPNLMKPFDKYMPSEYSQSAPIYNPNAILAAYAKHLPEFLDATRPEYRYKNPELIQTGTKRVKVGNGWTDMATDPKAWAAGVAAPVTGGLSLAAYGGYKASGGK